MSPGAFSVDHWRALDIFYVYQAVLWEREDRPPCFRGASCRWAPGLPVGSKVRSQHPPGGTGGVTTASVCWNVVS